MPEPFQTHTCDDRRGFFKKFCASVLGAVLGLAPVAAGLRVWLYPLPSLVALVGWCFLFVTSDPKVIAVGLLTLLVGVAGFFVWSWRVKGWPFAPATA